MNDYDYGPELRKAALSGDDEQGGAVLTEMHCKHLDPRTIWAVLMQALGEATLIQSAEAAGQLPCAARPPLRVVRPKSAEHVAAAEKALDDPHGRAVAGVTHGLLALVAVIEDAAERIAEDTDAAAAMVAERITSVEGAIDAVATGLVPEPRARWNPVRGIGAWLRYRWRSWRGTAPVPLVSWDCIGMCGQPAHSCGGCACAGGCRCSLCCRCGEASRSATPTRTHR